MCGNPPSLSGVATCFQVHRVHEWTRRLLALAAVLDGPSYQPCHFLRRRVGSRLVRNFSATAQYDHPIARREHVGHPMADEDDRMPLVLEALDQRKHLRDLAD